MGAVGEGEVIGRVATRDARGAGVRCLVARQDARGAGA
jgi:hypothetical protein